MDFFKQDMKAPMRPAPAVPELSVNRYSPVTNWNNDPFGTEVFEPNTQFGQKKKPPPRPPPPKVKQPDTSTKSYHFIRRPTVLSSLLMRKNKDKTNASVTNHISIENQLELDTNKVFSKCEVKNTHAGTLIDLSSPPSSPTFTTRSSSDGLSIDSFGSDATSSTNQHTAFGGSISQAESGFEDDFDLFFNTKKQSSDDLAVDPFSPPALKPQVARKPVFDLSNGKTNIAMPLNGPTIIRAKPARPKPPDSVAILKSSFGNVFPSSIMNLNTTTPIQKVNSVLDTIDPLNLDWDDSSDREASPPMPTIPPPPPPVIDDLDSWPDHQSSNGSLIQEEPYAIALFDYETDHADDLKFTVNTRIQLLRRPNKEWLYGRLENGLEGLFPSNFVEIEVPLPDDDISSTEQITAIALYDFHSNETGDLRFSCGDIIKIKSKISEEWYLGECNGVIGQFPVNYVEINQ